MAVQPIDVRLDQLTQDSASLKQQADLASAPPPSPGIDQAVDDFPTDLKADDVQVAGGRIEVIEQIVKKMKGVEIRKAPAPLSADAQKAADIQDLQKAAEITQQATKTEAAIAGKVELNKIQNVTPETFVQTREGVKAQADLTAKPPEAEFNLPVMQTSDDVKATIETINQVAGIKTQNITFEDVRLAAENSGIGVKFIDEVTSGKLQVNPENTYKAMNAMIASAKKLDSLAAKVADGTATPTELAEMAQTIHFHSVLQQSVKGYQTNVAQSLAVMRMPRDGAVDIANIMADFGNETDITKFAQAYLSLKTPEGKADLIRGMAQGNTWEKLFTVYVNGLLSRPGTHLKNALSNTVFLPWRMTERATSSALGGLRKAIGIGADDVYEFAEVPAMLGATPTAIRNGFELMSHAFTEGVPKGWADPTKIARQQSRMELINYRADGSLLSAGAKAINYVTTLPGRSLMSADEFFKGINYTYELSAEATRASIVAYDDALKSGASVADALKAQETAMDRFLLEPPEYIAGLAETGTFTKALEGVAGKMQASITPNTATGFALRTQMPFIATPVNVIGEVVARTPLAPFTKSFWAAMKQGGKESDMAMTKVGLGSAAMYGLSSLATNGNLTGAGPGDRGTRQAMERQGWQPYSIVLDLSNGLLKDGVNEDVRQAFSPFPGSVRFGSGDYAGKVFLSYQGMEPVGALMAMASDYVDYARYEQDDSRMNAYVGGLVFGVANYMMESPFLQGISNMTSLLGGQVPNTREHLVNMVNGFAKIATTTTLKALEPLSGAIISTKEKVDPLRRDYQADPNLPAGLKGLMDGLNKWRSETPGLSESLPPMLNIWGETVEHEYSWSPIRMKEGKQRDVDQALIQLNANVQMPQRQVSIKDPGTGINASTKLTTDEYNEMLRIANQQFKLEDKVLSAIKLVEADNGKTDLIHYQNAIKNVFSDVFEASKKVLIAQSIYAPEIQKRISDKAQRLKEFGLGAK